jgi:hypothetical protein
VGLEGRLVHDLRRTAVRNLERAGVSRSVAMKLTGHKTETVCRRYAIVSESDLSDGVKKLDSLLRIGSLGTPARPALHHTQDLLASATAGGLSPTTIEF